ncbi:UDP-N-acetylmuramoyl-tripeptide--D-alanyl-D-alanine ligase [Catenulispora rubra]|uniref:UDP-N-acetylmuramoyl-tripeptide--D-alanyl-D- alanine ligase n=1 Tax=Catenulispora rubra TaxID=280293 RepID=UPI00189239C6|nr:UDP-N-acetylmuramoyl-tripeptide--D-alanyl-D-alanine ligase [Catenulispora rubra]
MKALTLSDIAEIVGGELHLADPLLVVRGSVALDSRDVVPGGLFAAFDGAQVDGHKFAAAAVAAGASAVLASRPVPAPAVLVPDVRAALARLAHHQLADGRTAADGDPLVIGITGSFGKTTTKDLLAAILENEAPTVGTAGSFNNELGLPLTVLRADEATRYLVLEMGAARAGDLSYLTSIAPPRIGVVLAVGNAHVETFVAGAGPDAVTTSDPLDLVAEAKAELVQALPAGSAGGVAVLNADDPRVVAMAAQTDAEVVWFSRDHAHGDDHGHGRDRQTVISAVDERLMQGKPVFTLKTPDGEALVHLSLLGSHQVGNALAAAAVAWKLGIGTDRIAAALSATGPRSDSRLAVRTRDTDKVTVVDDAYNAFPESMAAALYATWALAADDSRRVVGVLGEMVAQGADSAARHRQIGTLAADLGFAALVVVDGPDTEFYDGTGPVALADAARERGPGMVVQRARDADEALALVRELIRPDDVVLVKGSHDLGLNAVAEALIGGG